MNLKTVVIYSVVLLSTFIIKLNAQNVNSLQADTTTLQNTTVQLVDDSLATKPTLNINLWTGLISNSTFGIHPLINISAGIGSPSNYYFLEYEHRYGHSKNNYQTIDDNTLKTVNAYNSSYFGFGYQRKIVSDKEFYALVGIGSDWFEVNKSDVIKNDKTLSGIAINVGLGYTYYFEAKHGPSIQILYHYANIANNNATTFIHNSVVIRITYLFGNDI